MNENMTKAILMAHYQKHHPKFKLGTIAVTPGVVGGLGNAIPGNDTIEEVLAKLIARHNSGDWGDLDDEDKATNEAGLKHGERLMSAYDDVFDGETVWVITERDRSVTTVLLPSEY